jgi:hypothetical protein
MTVPHPILAAIAANLILAVFNFAMGETGIAFFNLATALYLTEMESWAQNALDEEEL